MAVGDVERADLFNQTSKAQPTFGTIGSAKDFLSRDTNRARANFMDQINQLTQRDRQTGTGIPSTNDLGRLAGKLAPAYRQFETADIAALNLFNQQGTADRARLSDLQNLYSPKVPAPGFTDKTPGSVASQAIYSTPPPATIPNMTNVTGFKALGDMFYNQKVADANALANKQYWDYQNKMLNVLDYRGLGNQGPVA